MYRKYENRGKRQKQRDTRMGHGWVRKGKLRKENSGGWKGEQGLLMGSRVDAEKKLSNQKSLQNSLHDLNFALLCMHITSLSFVT